MNESKIASSKIIGVQFSLLSPDEIRKNSVVEVTSRDTYINNKPVIGGLFDPRMGVLEPGLICPTDGLTYIDTPGYFGHIEMARPVFFIQHLKEIMKISRCICFKCSKLLLNKAQHKHISEKSAEDRWDYVSALAAKIKRCGQETEDGCGCKQPDKIKLEGMSTLYAIWENMETTQESDNKKVNIKLTPELVLKIFKRISDEDVHFMGFNPLWSRPDWMICQVLPVPPPAVRPSVKHDAQQRSEDDLTHIYSNIIKTNTDLFNKLRENAQPNIIEGLTTVLQYFVAMIVNNKVKGAVPMAQRSGRPLQCIMGRLNSKNGRIRGNLMGKRVDFSARSVITGDPNLSIRQLGVPRKIAMNITKPITVNDLNRDFLMKLIQNGPDVYPGAKILERRNGEHISLRYVDRGSIRIENGDIVHRHMMDGDAVLFNRQPSLHRMSMMCHIAKIMERGDTFRMNVATTKPYNADFDGDEMNMHMPQSAIAETELRHLAAIPYQLISPAGNSPIIGIYQDSLLGSYRFTRSDIKFTPREAMNLLMMFNNVDTKKLRENGNKITNFDILSQILPPVTMVYKTKLFEDNEEYKNSNNVLEIRNGKYVRGQMEKSVLGSSTKGIIHRICNDFNNMASANFIDDLQNIITEYMKSSSFSVGISDLIADKKTAREIVQVITTQKMEVQNIIDKVHLGIFENNTAQSNNVEFETQVNNMLNKATEQSGKIGRKSLSKDNRFLMIVNSGSKGSLINISQMISCLGQQNVDGKRIPYGFDSRTLPHYSKFDDSPKARGFIENSYITGLTAPELFFHAMGGRIGLIDTACKSVTWETPVVIMENDKPIYIEIGRWIDNLLEKTPEKIKHYTDRQMELLDTDSIYIPTTDENGNVSWGEITAVTRHDPGDALYEIKTHGGRSVIVTESKSLLIWNPKTKTLDETSTPDIKIGDCVPVTGELCKPPTVLKHIDVVDYLPKTEFVYGTDFNIAVSMMKTEMQNKKKIPANWWDTNNSKHFTLPYSKKASLQRTSVRSNTENIKDGYVYPYHAQRKDTFIPEKFELNEENGIFLGLYLAEGHSHNSHVTITNNNQNIRDFVKSWFDKHNIAHTEKSKINKIGRLTTTVIGNSSILSKFLLKLVGHKAENKHVPTEAFTASNEFIIGLLNGYYSGDGSISKNSIDVGSASQRLIEGISMLCSRLGIFGRTSKVQMKKNNLQTKNIKPTYRLSISAHWACKFADQISFIEEVKNHKLKTKKWNNKKHMNFDTYNNVVLDKITEINILGIEKYPKVYDLTIPSTLNFGLANGLQVRDTSQTGYIQRRLIKGLEDLKVEYDMTVRNSKGKIVQFSYGDDGFDSTRVENQFIPLVGMSVEDIYMHYDILGVNDRDTELLEIYSKGTITRMKKQRPETRDKCKTYIEKMLLAREEIVKNIFKYKDENGVKLPVAFQNIITNIQGQLNLGSNTTVDITPMEAFELIEFYFNKVRELHYVPPTELFEIMYYYYLTPKDLLVTKRFHRKALVLLLETIVLKYKQAIVHPGEMVGVIAGQSIGEPTTQLTLNTFHHSGVASKSNVTRGVPRIEEILRLTKNPKNPSLTVHLKPLDELEQEKAIQYANMMEHTKLVDVVKSLQICFDPQEESTLIEADKLLMEQYYEFENMVKECNEQEDGNVEIVKSKWIIRMEMDAEVLLDKNITMDDIHFAIKNSHYGNDITCVYSDYNSDKLVFRIRMNSNVFKSKKSKGFSEKGITDSLDQSDDIYLLKNFQDSLLNNIVLRGVNGIENVIPRKLQNMIVKEEGKYVKKDVWILDTTGSNLMETLAIDFIDNKRTYSNDIKEVFDVLGIEAARQVLYNEFVDVMEFSDVYINYHHLSLLCDRMTCTKDMVSIFRSGILNDDIGPIAKGTFEVHTEVFLNAARHADFDHMRGVSANVMMGQVGYYGTNAFNLVLDMKETEKLADAQLDISDTNTDIEKMFKISEDKSDICSKSNIVIQNNIANIKQGETKICDDDYNMGF
jgi:DNA-directed RNA polymerase beta' subunit